MQQGSSIKNIWQNMTKGQKRALIFGFVMILVLIVVLSFVTSIPEEEIFGGIDEGAEVSEGTSTEVSYDESGNTVVTTTDAKGNSVTTTYYNRQGKIEAKTNAPQEKTGTTVYYDEDGNTVIKTVTINDDGSKMESEIKQDSYGNVNTTDPKLISTYFPHQIMREHEGGDSTFRVFMDANTKDKVIEAVIESCAEDEDKALVQEYVKNVPIDMSAYTISYTTAREDVDCDQ